MRALRIPAVLAAAWAASHFGGCGRDFSHPFDPRSDVYAGSAWSRDGDGDGVADSVEKYAPGCASGPADCLRKAQANAGLPPSHLDSVAAEDLSLPVGGPAAPARWRWYPAGLSGITYSLASDDPAVAAAADSLVRPLAPGTTGFTLTARTASGQSRTARFTVSVEAVIIPVRAVKVPDMSITLLTEADDRVREPDITWTPANASDKGYALASDNPSVVRVVGGSVEAMRKGDAKITITSDDGGKRDTFKVKVNILIPCGGLLNPCPDGDD